MQICKMVNLSHFDVACFESHIFKNFSSHFAHFVWHQLPWSQLVV